VEVVSIDRTGGLLNQPAQWLSRKPEDRSAYARIAFVDLPDGDRASIDPGLPVLVSIPRKLTLAASLFGTVHAASRDLATRLWHGDRATDRDFEPVRARLVKAADTALRSLPAPVVTIRSAGVTDQSAADFRRSRRAFQDADNAAILALAARLTGTTDYADAARRIVSAWALVNQPTGHPIDETRLEGFLWALDLLGGDARNASVAGWLERWAAAKRKWTFGPTTATNNHKTHHLKILLMLDKLLDRDADYAKDLAAAERHLSANLAEDGRSIDYQQRDAMHYHVFNVEAWIEIALVTGCCRERVDRAFAFFERKLADDPRHVEFANTTAPIDRARADAGFAYAKPHAYDPAKAARAMFGYAALTGSSAAGSATRGAQHSNLFYEARSYLWQQR
jgi:hypothetical protein